VKSDDTVLSDLWLEHVLQASFISDIRCFSEIFGKQEHSISGRVFSTEAAPLIWQHRCLMIHEWGLLRKRAVEDVDVVAYRKSSTTKQMK
jgi:hypothetical protein